MADSYDDIEKLHDRCSELKTLKRQIADLEIEYRNKRTKLFPGLTESEVDNLMIYIDKLNWQLHLNHSEEVNNNDG